MAFIDIPKVAYHPENLDFIRADMAWCYSTGDSNVIIGICDEYVMISQVDLKDKIPYIYNA